jgi:hypothetical protein
VALALLQKGRLLTPGFMVSVYLSFVSCKFVLSAARRQVCVCETGTVVLYPCAVQSELAGLLTQVIAMWTGSLLDKAQDCSGLGSPGAVAFGRGRLDEHSASLGLASLAPNTRQIEHIVTAIQKTFVVPGLKTRDELVALTCG